jgi:nitroreductase
MNAILERQSVRRFENRSVEPEKIDAVLRAGMSAPSGGNQRPWEFYVIKDKDILERLARSSPYAVSAAGATVVIVPCFRTDDLIYPELVFMDMSACVENMLIEITAQGLGGVWLSIAPYEDRMKNVDEILGIVDGLRSFALIPVGYPAMKRTVPDRYEKNRVHA